MLDLDKAIADREAILAKVGRELEVLREARRLASPTIQPNGVRSTARVGAVTIVQGPKKNGGSRVTGQFAPDSAVGATIRVLRSAKSELHIKEIMQRIAELGTFKQSTVQPSIHKLIGKGRVFYKSTAAPATYGLLEWRDTPTQSALGGKSGRDPGLDS